MYGKTFQSLWLGSMRGKPELQLVFIYMFCNCDRDGVIDCIPQVIADATGLEDKQVVDAICELESADPDSRTAENEGRRIEQIDANRTWGWRIINHAKYLREGSEEHRKEKSAERQKRHRERNAPVTHSNAPVTPVSISVSSSVSDKEGDYQGETKSAKEPYGEFKNILLAKQEYDKLCSVHGQPRLMAGIDYLGNYLINAPKKKYASHYAVLKKGSWVWENVKTRTGNMI